MANKSIFNQFLSAVWKHFKLKYPFIKRLEKPYCCPGIPRSSSFYVGISSRFGKHVVVNFQHSPKPWQIGEFTINIDISERYEASENNDYGSSDGYGSFSEGFYRLASTLFNKDKWWCLKPTSLARDNDLITYWRPSSYDSDETVINEAVADVCNLLEEHVFRKGGFMN